MSRLQPKTILVTVLIIFAVVVLGWIIEQKIWGPGGTAVKSGVSGVTAIDGGCAVVREGQNCGYKPLSANIQILNRNNKVVLTTKSDSNGYFAAMLPPGVYTVKATNTTGAAVPTAQPLVIKVSGNQITKVTINFDSGIR